MTKKILLPVDHTDESSWKKALPAALELAGFYGAELQVLSVIPEVIRLPNLPANYGAGAKDHVTRVIQSILDANNASGVPVHIAQGSVYREILKFAYREQVDLIVMASPEGDFPNFEIGPHLSRVMRNAHCNVLNVRN